MLFNPIFINLSSQPEQVNGKINLKKLSKPEYLFSDIIKIVESNENILSDKINPNNSSESKNENIISLQFIRPTGLKGLADKKELNLMAKDVSNLNSEFRQINDENFSKKEEYLKANLTEAQLANLLQILLNNLQPMNPVGEINKTVVSSKSVNLSSKTEDGLNAISASANNLELLAEGKDISINILNPDGTEAEIFINKSDQNPSVKPNNFHIDEEFMQKLEGNNFKFNKEILSKIIFDKQKIAGTNVIDKNNISVFESKNTVEDIIKKLFPDQFADIKNASTEKIIKQESNIKLGGRQLLPEQGSKIQTKYNVELKIISNESVSQGITSTDKISFFNNEKQFKAQSNIPNSNDSAQVRELPNQSGQTESSTASERDNNGKDTKSDNFKNLNNIKTAEPSKEISTEIKTAVKQLNDIAQAKNVKSSALLNNLPDSEIPLQVVKANNLIVAMKKIIEGRKTREVELKLEPESLGKVKILLNIVDKQVKANVEVENQQVKNIIQTNNLSLKQSLAESGIVLSALNVSISYKNENKQSKQSGNKTKSDFIGYDAASSSSNEFNEPKIKNLGYNTYEFLA